MKQVFWKQLDLKEKHPDLPGTIELTDGGDFKSLTIHTGTRKIRITKKDWSSVVLEERIIPKKKVYRIEIRKDENPIAIDNKVELHDTLEVAESIKQAYVSNNFIVSGPVEIEVECEN